MSKSGRRLKSTQKNSSVQSSPRHKNQKWNDIDLKDTHISKIGDKNNRFNLAFCTDIRAPRSVIGVKEMNEIFSALNSQKPALNSSRNRFRFADAVFNSLGQIVLPLLTPLGQPSINVTLDVVTADIPALLGMDLLNRESLTP